mgnify:CR=1 FL=1
MTTNKINTINLKRTQLFPTWRKKKLTSSLLLAEKVDLAPSPHPPWGWGGTPPRGGTPRGGGVGDPYTPPPGGGSWGPPPGGGPPFWGVKMDLFVDFLSRKIGLILRKTPKKWNSCQFGSPKNSPFLGGPFSGVFRNPEICKFCTFFTFPGNPDFRDPPQILLFFWWF